MNKRVRVRFAPSPTGPLHIGGVRTCLFNFLMAKKHGGDFILRIEDTDSKREVAGSMDYIRESLEWLGITPDEATGLGGEYGPYKQSMRAHIYKKYVDMLVESGHAYYAFDTPEELDKMRDDLKAAGVKNVGYAGTVRDRMKNSLTMSGNDAKAKIDAGEPYVVRFKMPRNEDVRFEDKIRGWVVFNTSSLDDKVIWKSSDGLPTYHLANVIDDYLMEITHVIRGEEWVSSTPLHILLYKAFGWEHPEFSHLPLILGPDGKKLGKRNKYGIPVFPLDWKYTDPDGEEVSILGFREAGYEPDALINFLALLGWNPGNNLEHMSLDEMINLFSLERVNNSGAMFDKKKLDSFNAHYLRSRSRDYILSFLDIPKDLVFAEKKLDLIAKMATERAVFATDLPGSIEYMFYAPALNDEIALKNVEDFVKVMSVFVADDFMSEFDDSDWTPEHIRMELESISTNVGPAIGKIMPMLRVALTGGKPGPQLPDIMYIIGPVETKNRINALLNKIRELA
jgi:glutamyl-tRNA synthetase